ncbi:MAG: UDP-N-acetyl-D-mannosamine dehydrogenase [Rhizobiaceae bacterium]|nr:UDP-N-acetyl-D-mannosamine dehydrogenase [Rhizobiaceae bacterium]
MTTFSKISVFGLGYIGLPTAAVFASRKVQVIGVDVNEATVDTINRGEIHIVEPDLDIVVRAAVTEKYLKATTIPEPAEAFLVAVPTPFKGDDHEPDLTYIEAAAKAIAPVLETGNLVVLESTSPVGATEKMAAWLAESRPDLTFPQTHGEASDIRIAHCPERVLPGQVMRELVENDRVIGGMTKACSQKAIALYKIFVKGDCVISNARTAEMAKLTENSFRDVNIAFANELSMICDKLDIDVWELIALANRHPRVNILQPGPGVGGHCIAVDPWFIVSRTPEIARLIRTAREVNNVKPEWVIEKIDAAIGSYLMENPTKTANDITLGCYGLAFKPDIDDLRESPSLDIVRVLAARKTGRLLVVEPNIEDLSGRVQNTELVSYEEAVAQANVHVLLVAHKEFKAADRPNGHLVDVTGTWTVRSELDRNG